MDIVDKLRDRANAPTLAVSELNHDAADEIERLRAWVSVKTQEEARAHDYSVRMHDENERLRKALEKIVYLEQPQVRGLPRRVSLSEIARAALAENEKKQ